MPSGQSIRQHFLPLESVKVGRFVVNINQPHQDYHDPTWSIAPEILKTTQSNYAELGRDNESAAATLGIFSLAGGSYKKQGGEQEILSTGRSNIYQLTNSKKWFEAAVARGDTRKWIEEAIECGDEIFMIVGYQTLLDARFNSAIETSTDTSAAIQAPLNALAAAPGTNTPLGNFTNPSLSGVRQTAQNANKTFVASGVQICALQYRRVKFKWYSSRNVEQATLEKGARWKVTWDLRGQDPVIDDVLEVELSEEELIQHIEV